MQRCTHQSLNLALPHCALPNAPRWLLFSCPSTLFATSPYFKINKRLRICLEATRGAVIAITLSSNSCKVPLVSSDSDERSSDCVKFLQGSISSKFKCFLTNSCDFFGNLSLVVSINMLLSQRYSDKVFDFQQIQVFFWQIRAIFLKRFFGCGFAQKRSPFSKVVIPTCFLEFLFIVMY